MQFSYYEQWQTHGIVSIRTKLYRYALYSTLRLDNNLLQISRGLWIDTAAENRLASFLVDVIDRMAEPPWNDTYAKDNNFTVSNNINSYNMNYK